MMLAFPDHHSKGSFRLVAHVGVVFNLLGFQPEDVYIGMMLELSARSNSAKISDITQDYYKKTFDGIK